MNTLYAGLVVWLVTLIIVESELLRPVRDLISGTKRYDISGESGLRATAVIAARRKKLGYLLGCHLCTGCWVALGVAFVVPGPLPLLLNAVLYKAVGHGVLEVTALLRRTNA